MVVCADCGNNCCNGGSGKSMYDKDCNCDEAYDHQSKYLADNSSVSFEKDERVDAKKNNTFGPYKANDDG